MVIQAVVDEGDGMLSGLHYSILKISLTLCHIRNVNKSLDALHCCFCLEGMWFIAQHFNMLGLYSTVFLEYFKRDPSSVFV